MLEEKLSQRRKRRMEQLEQRQMEETKVLSGSSASSFLLDASCSPAEGDKFVKQITHLSRCQGLTLEENFKIFFTRVIYTNAL